MRSLGYLWGVLALSALGCGEASINLPESLAVSYVLPHHGAINVGVATSIEIGFNGKVDYASVTADSIVLEQAGQRVAAQQVFPLDGQVVVLVPDTVLNAGSQYNILVAESVSGEQTGELGAPMRTRFRTAP